MKKEKWTRTFQDPFKKRTVTLEVEEGEIFLKSNMIYIILAELTSRIEALEHEIKK